MTDLATMIVGSLTIVTVLLGMLGTLATVLGAAGIAVARISDDAPMQANATRYLIGGICLLVLCAVLHAPEFAEWMADIILGTC